MPVMLGPILGPTVGGFLVEYVDWRWVFFINIPIGVLSVALGASAARDAGHARPALRHVRLRAGGTVLDGALLGLSRAPTAGWDDPGVVGLLALAAVTLPIFIWWELRTPEPLLNLRLFAIPDFAIGGVVNFVATVSMFGAIFLVPVFLQNVRGMGPMQTGLILVPQALASTVSIMVGGRLYDQSARARWCWPGWSSWPPPPSRWPRWTDDVRRNAAVVTGATRRGHRLPDDAGDHRLARRGAGPTSAASALNNVMRQMFSAFATAVFASILLARTGFHQANLAMFVAPDTPAVARLLAQGQQFALEHGLRPAAGQGAGSRSIGGPGAAGGGRTRLR